MTEAFVYKWTNIVTGMWYIGYHKGSRNIRDYTGSGKYFIEDYDKNPSNWRREILFEGSIEDCYELETKLLQESNAKDDPMSYNKHNNNFPYVANDPEINAKKSKTMKKYYAENPEARAEMSKAMKKYLKENPDKHPMKNPEVAAKNAESRKKYFKENPEARAEKSKAMKNPDKNPMKRPEVAAKNAEARKKYWANKKEINNSSTLEEFFV